MPENEIQPKQAVLLPLPGSIASSIIAVEGGQVENGNRQASSISAKAEVQFFAKGPEEAQEEHENGIRCLIREGLANEIKIRKLFSKCLFGLVASWIAAVMTVLFMQGCCSKNTVTCIVDEKTAEIQSVSFFLSDSVLIALISGTSVSVIGLLVTVVNYIFPKESDLLRWAQSPSARHSPNSPKSPAADS
jgi:hypothetical protein